jgi:hypothetical protein
MRSLAGDAMASTRVAALGFALALIAISARADSDEPVTAVWKEKRLSFTYDGTSSIYSCDALAGRVKSILLALGARDDIRTSASSCSHSNIPTDVYVNDPAHGGDPRMPPGTMPPGSMPSMSIPSSHINRNIDQRQFQMVHIEAMLPVVVTPEVLKELEKDKSRRELIARVTGNQAARFNDPVQFQAQRFPVTLSHKTVGLEPEECDLLDQMAGSLFPQIGVRVLHRGFSCDPDGASRLPPELVAEALLPVAYGGHHPAPAPMKDDDGKDRNAPAAPAGDAAKPAADPVQK